jgi:Spy/CpxP family protein refolding chaperone
MKKLVLGLILATALPTLAQTTNATAGSATPSADAGAAAAGDARREKFKEALAQLNLTDEQKQKIEQIRASTPRGKERRHQMMAVLNPEQKARLKQMFAAWRQTHGAASRQ